jgi:4-hydroxy 2-oxovalerate aldolase
MLPLRQQIEWGYIIPYMLTGILNEHPRTAIACRESADKDKYAEFYERLLEGVVDDKPPNGLPRPAR